jgi:peptidoglycan/LPS O-acetylase OafA/YrhL
MLLRERVPSPAAPSPPATAAGRRTDIQGLRGIAVLLVVVFHAGVALPGGFVGVDVFFVISGFVITQMLVTELLDSGGIDLRRFYLRRLRRLVPALGLAVGVVSLLVVAFAPVGAQHGTITTGIAASLLSANAHLYRSAAGYFDLGTSANAFLHTWSLSVEEQFYLLFPATLLVSWKVGSRTRFGATKVTIAVMSMLAAVSLLLSWEMSDGTTVLPIPRAATFAFYASPVRAWEFAAGVLLALAGPGLLARTRSMAMVYIAIGAALVAWSALELSESAAFPGVLALLPVAGTVLLIAAGGAAGEFGTRPLTGRVLNWLGDRSYSWYLWHWPLIVFARSLWPGSTVVTAIAAALSIVPAWLSYRFVETPIRFMPRPTPRRTLVTAGAFVIVPVFACGTALAADKVIRSRQRVAHFQQALGQHISTLNGCSNGHLVGSAANAKCRWANGGASSVLLIGDSNAAHFSEAAVRGAQSTEADLEVSTKAGCPFVEVEIRRNGRPDPACETYVRSTVAAIKRRHPDVVFMSTAFDRYLIDEFRFRKPGSSAWVTGHADKARLLTEQLTAVTADLTGAGIGVVFLETLPKFKAWDPRLCAQVKVLLAPTSCGIARPRSLLEARRREAVELELAAARRSDMTTVDFADVLCETDRCSAYRDGNWWYLDNGHISIHTAKALAPEFADLIRSTGRAVAARS